MKLAPSQPLGVSIVLKWDELRDRPHSWVATVIQGHGARVTVGIGMSPGEAINYALLHMGMVDGTMQPSDISGDLE